jgi:hypothetical protein
VVAIFVGVRKSSITGTKSAQPHQQATNEDSQRRSNKDDKKKNSRLALNHRSSSSSFPQNDVILGQFLNYYFFQKGILVT